MFGGVGWLVQDFVPCIIQFNKESKGSFVMECTVAKSHLAFFLFACTPDSDMISFYAWVLFGI